MGKRRKSGPKGAVPDDYFAAGPFEFARFGKVVVGRSRATAEQFQEATERMAELLPKVIADINQLVAAIASRVSGLPPDRLLHRAWWEFASKVLLDSVRDAEETGALRMIDYVQSVVASVPPAEEQADTVSEDEWAQLRKDVQTLFRRVTTEYQMCVTASSRISDPKLDMEMEEFRFRAEALWMNVRGKRYQVHECQALEDLIAPHSDEIRDLFGIDAQTLVAELGKILTKLTRGAVESMLSLKQLHQDSIPRLKELATMPEVTSIDDLRDKLWEDPDLAARRDAVIGDVFGTGLFDVEKNSMLPRTLIDALTWDPGEEKEFFGPGKFCGWPQRIWPTMKRPFIRVNGRVLCFDMFGLFDNFYRSLQRIVLRLDPSYKDKWNERQQAVSEELPFRYFRKLLPGMQQTSQIYYRWNPGGGKANWYEADGLVIYDDHLFVVEVKGGAFTYTSPATDLAGHISSLKNLLLHPASQGSRFVDYLESAPEVAIADTDHNEIGRLRRSNFRHVTVVAITIDAFTALAARAQHLRSVGIDIGTKPVWALSLDDLRVYADHFDNPLTFLHFVEQRMRAAASELVDLDDELDHLGLYLAQNDYAEYAREMTEGRKTSLHFNGYRSPIDEYYAAVINGESPVPPRKPLPERIGEIIDFLAASTERGRSEIASFFLDAAGDYRESIAKSIEEQLESNTRLGRARPFSTHGGHPFTVFTWSPAAPRDPSIVVEHTRTVAAANGESSRLVVELEYDVKGSLEGMHWQHVGFNALSQSELARLHAAGHQLRRQRVAAARSKGKIGVNEQCPCGSGRKYKRCCKP